MNLAIHKIVNVYQHKYHNWTSPIGVGDFLRGCISLLQISKRYHVQCELYINTQIQNYLKNFKHDEMINTIHSSINYYTKQNEKYDNDLHHLHHYYEYNNFLDGFVSFCNTTTIHNNTIYILTNAYPIQNVTHDERLEMQSLLEPTEEMSHYIDIHLNNIRLSPKSYNIIHIRLGDEYLINNQHIHESRLHHITQMISLHMDATTSYILLSDNNDLNMYISATKSNIKTIINKKMHTGTEAELIDIKNTLLDFYIMSKSNYILSFSVYGHGSSFSKWCAEIYNIPISSFIIQ